MRRHALLNLFATAALALMVVGAARGNTVRYAVVVGSNLGTDPSNQVRLPPLLHAENEAERLRDDLVRYASADPSPARTVLLKRPTSKQLRAALERLARQVAADTARLQGARTLFTFFFTGHGLRGQLLLADGPMSSKDLGLLLKGVGADLTLAVFDACYSGSFDARSLRAKGIEPESGSDLLAELPREVLRASGQMWFVSSGPEEVSYEDARLGGVFTHFFRKALRHAPKRGPGITLDAIWRYTYDQTVDFTTARRRKQTPRQLVTSLERDGAVFFSFPAGRTATLELDAAVGGEFALLYKAGGLVQLVDKRPGRRMRLEVFEGEARLARMVGGSAVPLAPLRFAKGRTVRLSPTAVAAAPPLGRQSRRLWSKGPADDGDAAVRAGLTAYDTGVGWTFGLGAGYGILGRDPALLAPEHHVGMVLSVDRGPFSMNLVAAYGFGADDFDVWRYELQAFVAELRAGYTWLVGPARFAVKGALRGGAQWQTYGDGRDRTAGLFQVGAIAELLVPTRGPLHVVLWGRADVLIGPSAADVEGVQAGLAGGGGAALAVRLY